MIRNILLFSIFLMALACGQSSTAKDSTSEENQGAEDKPLVVDKYTLSPFTQSPEFSDAKMESYTFKNGTWDFKVSGKDYALGEQTPDAGSKGCANSGKGQHIHLIVDNEPYSAQYTSNFAYALEDGEHYLLAFLSRSYHESLKHPSARQAEKINVQNGSIIDSKPLPGPMLFYSRPKGTYIGEDTENVMLDFYAHNADIGNEYLVRATINGEPHILREWKPLYISGLPMGENTIELELIDMDMNRVNVPLNPVSRTFTLKELPDPESK